MAKLTDKQLVFVNEYVETRDPTESARRAGYKHPRQAGSQNLGKVHVNGKIQERLKATTERKFSKRDLVTLATRMSRLGLAQAIGQTAYGGERDYYQSLGYPTQISFETYQRRYERQDIASRIVDLPATDTWKKPPVVSEDGEAQTLFVRAWEELETRLRVWAMLSRVDRLSGIGRFGVLLIGVKDGNDLEQPVGEGSLQSERDVLYLRPFSEGSVEIEGWEEDAQSTRYGLPLTYRLALREDKPAVVVHWTRALHVAEGKLDSEVYAPPRLRSVFNRLDDLMKIVGGAAEATWLLMRPGTLMRPQEGYDLDMTDAALEDELEKYAHDPLRLLFLEGIEAQQIGASEVVDPRGPFEVTLSLIAAARGIPQRKLLGSAEGQLAAAEYDMKQWAGEVAHRQKVYAEPEVLRPFIDRLIWMGALPVPPNGYHIGQKGDDGEWHWPALMQTTEVEEAEILKSKAAAAASLANKMTGELPPTRIEAREWLGLPAEPERTEAVSSVPEALAVAISNYHRGDISADDLARFAIAEVAEGMRRE